LLGDKRLDDLKREIGDTFVGTHHTGLIKGKEAENENRKVIQQMSHWQDRRGKAGIVSDLFSEYEQLFEIHNQSLHEQTSRKELLGIYWTDENEEQ
jgi:hypothetical protein